MRVAMKLRALARLATPGARKALMDIAGPRRKGLRRSLPRTSREMLAALGGLAASWDADPDVQSILKLAKASNDPEVRKAVA